MMSHRHAFAIAQGECALQSVCRTELRASASNFVAPQRAPLDHETREITRKARISTPFASFRDFCVPNALTVPLPRGLPRTVGRAIVPMTSPSWFPDFP